MNLVNKLVAGTWLLLALVSCSTIPQAYGPLEHAQNKLEQLAEQEQVQQLAPERLEHAEQAFARAQQAWQDREPQEFIDHYVYLAERRITIAEEASRLGQAEEEVRRGEDLRRNLLSQVQEAERQRPLTNRASISKLPLADALADLENELAAVAARQAENALVLVLDDIIFEPDQAHLNEDFDRTLDRVAELLNDYPKRHLEINGYTDNHGTSSDDQQLSQQKAEAIAQALIDRGVDPTRISIYGHPTGRVENRRVEIVIEAFEQESLSQR